MTKQKRSTGRFVTTRSGEETVRAFVPHPLPPEPPIPVELFYGELDRANQALGRLDSLQVLLPNLNTLLYFYNRREALLSSQIEGTQSSFSDLLLSEHKLLIGQTDADEVSNYVAAMDHGLARIQKGFPLSSRLFREMHAILLRSGRGVDKTPGEFRTSQNWIGGQRPGNAAYVPPPPHELVEVMSHLERFLHREECRLPILIDAALAHVQFESAHPFLDGNGRIGRLLITLLLCERKVLRSPSLYLSLYFKEHRQRYYELLQGVRVEGDWESWIKFFLDGVADTAEQACVLAAMVRELLEKDRHRIEKTSSSVAPLRIQAAMEKFPLATQAVLSEHTGLAPGTVSTAVAKLVSLGVVTEITGRKRDRIFEYTQYLRLLSGGTEPIRPQNAD